MAETLIVGCKLPHGLEIQLAGKPVVLRGSNNATIAGAYGLTYGVDKAAFEEWLKTYKDFPAVQNQMIFAQATEKSAVAQAEELEKEATGFEGLNPDKPAPGIEPTDEQKQKTKG